MDESGDTGLKPRDGSTRFFVLTLLLLEGPEAAEKISLCMETLRMALHLPPRYEFHFFKTKFFKTKFFKTKNTVRRTFLEAIRGEDFRYCSLVVDKQRLHGPEFERRDLFCQQVCVAAFSRAAPWLLEANVQFDESGSRDSQKQLASYLLRVINAPSAGIQIIRKIGSQQSAENNLMQLADMLCGSVARAYEKGKEAEDRGEFRRIVRARELWVKEWPKQRRSVLDL